MPAKNIEKLADDLLLRLRRRPLRPTPLSTLNKAFRADSEQTDAALAVLKTLGYKIRRRKNAVTFVAAPDTLIETEISYQLKTKVIGKRVCAYGSVKSTNDVAARSPSRSSNRLWTTSDDSS